MTIALVLKNKSSYFGIEFINWHLDDPGMRLETHIVDMAPGESLFEMVKCLCYIF